MTKNAPEKPWAPDGSTSFWYSRSTLALCALVNWFQETRRRAPVVWVPDYFCNEALAPFRDLGATVILYPISQTLAVEWSSHFALAARAKPDFVILVHYFGHEADGAAAADFCRQTGAHLIEDATHVLRPFGAIGKHAAFTLYSPYKFLAVPDGGVLVASDSSIAGNLKHSLPPRKYVRPLLWWVRKSIQKLLPSNIRQLIKRSAPLEFAVDPLPRALIEADLSDIARRMITYNLDTLEWIESVRKRNAAALRDVDWPVGVRPFFSKDSEGPAPYRFVLHCDNSDIATFLYNRLLSGNCAVETWPDLPPDVRVNAREHVDALALRNQLLFLPVHQSLDPDRLRAVYSAALRA